MSQKVTIRLFRNAKSYKNNHNVIDESVRKKGRNWRKIANTASSLFDRTVMLFSPSFNLILESSFLQLSRLCLCCVFFCDLTCCPVSFGRHVITCVAAMVPVASLYVTTVTRADGAMAIVTSNSIRFIVDWLPRKVRACDELCTSEFLADTCE